MQLIARNLKKRGKIYRTEKSGVDFFYVVTFDWLSPPDADSHDSASVNACAKNLDSWIQKGTSKGCLRQQGETT